MAKRKGGLPKKYAKMGFKKGWKAYKASKKSTTKKRSTTAKKSNPGGRKTAKFTRIRMVPISVGVNAAYQMGFVEAGEKLLEGDFAGAGEAIRDNSGSIRNWIEVGVPAIIAKGFKSIFGSVPLISAGKFKLDLF